MIAFLNFYLNLNFLIVLGWLCLLPLSFVSSPSRNLRMHYHILFAIFTLALIQPMIPHREFFVPFVKVWSLNHVPSYALHLKEPVPASYFSFRDSVPQARVTPDQVKQVFVLLFALSIVVGVFQLARDLVRLLRIRNESFLIRKIKRVEILAHGQIRIPFSFWIPFRQYVVIPTSAMPGIDSLKLMIKHELQHHRQRDTRWVYLFWFLRCLCVLNPFIYLWQKTLSALQEFACDEALVDRYKVDSHAYASCLLEAAKTLIQPERSPICATGFLFWVDRTLLKRRIEQMIVKTKTKKAGSKIAVALGVVSVVLLSMATYASQGWINDRKITTEKAQMMLKNAGPTEFPVQLNEAVLEQLNHYLGSPEGRSFMRESIARMKTYEAEISSKLHEYAVPAELVAIPLVESGYKNRRQDSNIMHGAGIWMFIARTARDYGMQVSDSADERLNPLMETTAAMRLLKSDARFYQAGGNSNAWQLSVISYNAGREHLNESISALNTRDPWILTANTGDRNYLAQVTAAILILKNQEMLQ